MIDYAITLVKNEDDATILNAHDLQYVYNQLCTEKRSRPWANPPSDAGKDRCFMEVEAGPGLFKLLHFSHKEVVAAMQDDRKLVALRWVHVAEVEEF